jgi:hypothetical protein
MVETEIKGRSAPVVAAVSRGFRGEPALRPPAEPTPEMREALRRLREADRDVRRAE